MAKYKVHCYYEYVGVIEVEADSPEEAFEKGFPECEKMETQELSFVGYTSSEVINEKGELTEFQ